MHHPISDNMQSQPSECTSDPTGRVYVSTPTLRQLRDLLRSVGNPADQSYGAHASAHLLGQVRNLMKVILDSNQETDAPLDAFDYALPLDCQALTSMIESLDQELYNETNGNPSLGSGFLSTSSNDFDFGLDDSFLEDLEEFLPTAGQEPKPQGSHICPNCPESFTGDTAVKLEAHARQTGCFPFICPECKNKAYRRQDSLNRHIYTWHKPHDPHNCDQCPKSFKRKDVLTLHKKLIHANDANDGSDPTPAISQTPAVLRAPAVSDPHFGVEIQPQLPESTQDVAMEDDEDITQSPLFRLTLDVPHLDNKQALIEWLKVLARTPAENLSSREAEVKRISAAHIAAICDNS